jgi:DNA-binding transcriptional LysR family regulator
MDGKSYPPRIMQLRIRELMLLELIQETGSLRGAAARLHVTQPSITQALRSLEQALGVALVERGNRGQRRTRLTAAGIAACHRMRVIGAEILAMQRAALEAGHRHELRVGAMPFMALAWMPNALARLSALLPRVRVELVEGSKSELWRLFSSGELDMVVDTAPAPPSVESAGDELVSRVIGDFPILVVAPTGHPLLRRQPAPLSVLAQHEWVLPAADSFGSVNFREIFQRAGLRAPEPAMIAVQHFTRLAVAQRLNMLTLVVKDALDWQQGSPRMRPLKCEFPKWTGRAVLTTTVHRLTLPAVKAFFELKL